MKKELLPVTRYLSLRSIIQENIGLKLPGKTIPVYTGPRPTHGIQDFLNIKF